MNNKITIELSTTEADILMAILRKETFNSKGFVGTAEELHERVAEEFDRAISEEPLCRMDESMDGDFDSAMESAGHGTDEDYNHYSYDE